MSIYGQLPPPNAQELYNFLVPAACVFGMLFLIWRFWALVKKEFASKSDFDALCREVKELKQMSREKDLGGLEKLHQKFDDFVNSKPWRHR